MDKSIYSEDYTTFLRILRRIRKNSKLTQEDLAARLGRTQSFISKYERGERRLDIMEVRAICDALGTSLPKLVADLEKALTKE